MNGSGDSLKVSLRWGRNPKARQMRLMVMRRRPFARANDRLLQCVVPRGVVSNVATTTCFDLCIRNGSWRGRAWLVQQPLQPVPHEAGACRRD